jgi:4-carboxymuconolactone decarboxylase
VVPQRLSGLPYRHLKVESQMDREPTTMEKTFGDFAPKIVELTDQVLFADIWERPGLSKRERSLITVAALIAMNRTEQLRFHIPNAIRNGVTQEEVIEAITHLAFYAGWPSAMSALQLAKELLAAEGGKRDAAGR